MNDFSTKPMNLHNHTTFSDGALEPEGLISLASEAGIGMVAATDHFITEKVGRSVKPSDIPEYAESIRAAARRVVEGEATGENGSVREDPGSRIVVLAGLEIDSCCDRTDLQSLVSANLGCLDFLLFEYINDDQMGGMPLDKFIEFRRRIPLPVGLAHTDPARVFNRINPSVLASVLVKEKIFFELTGGGRNTVWDPVEKRRIQPWERAAGFVVGAARDGLKYTVGTDTHADPDEIGMTAEAYSFIDANRLRGSLMSFPLRSFSHPR